MRTNVELAQSLFLPILDYADVYAIDLNEVLLNKLQCLQNLCNRFIYGFRKLDFHNTYNGSYICMYIHDTTPPYKR